MTILVHLNDLSEPVAYDLEDGQEATEHRCKTAFLATSQPQGLVDVADAFGKILKRYDFCPH